MKPDAITALFAEAAAAVTPIVGNPTDDDLTAIREILTPLLLGVPYDTAGPHNLVGLIMPKAAYRSAYSVAFKYPARPELYDGNIADDATPVVRARMEAAHTNKRSDYECYDAAERATVKFLRDLVDETWYKDLKDAEAFYTEVTAFDLLDHLDRNCGGLHAIDLVHLNTEMMGYYAEAEGIPKYINMLGDAQHKAERAKMPIANVQLVKSAPMRTGRPSRMPKRLGPSGNLPSVWPTSHANASSLPPAEPSPPMLGHMQHRPLPPPSHLSPSTIDCPQRRVQREKPTRVKLALSPPTPLTATAGRMATRLPQCTTASHATTRTMATKMARPTPTP